MMMTTTIDCDDDDDCEGDKGGEGGTVFSCKRAMSGNVSRSPKRTLCKGTIPDSNALQVVYFFLKIRGPGRPLMVDCWEVKVRDG